MSRRTACAQRRDDAIQPKVAVYGVRYPLSSVNIFNVS